MNQADDEKLITEVINRYFSSTYHGDAEQIHSAFHPEAHITGIIDKEVFDWKLASFVERIAQAPSAAEKNEKFDKKILSMDIENNAAMVKARVVISKYTFIDYIILLKIDDKWIIRNKSFTTL